MDGTTYNFSYLEVSKEKDGCVICLWNFDINLCFCYYLLTQGAEQGKID